MYPCLKAELDQTNLILRLHLQGAEAPKAKAKKKQPKTLKQAVAEEELEAAPAEETMAEDAAAGEPVGPLVVKSELPKKARANKHGPAEATEVDVWAQGRSP